MYFSIFIIKAIINKIHLHHQRQVKHSFTKKKVRWLHNNKWNDCNVKKLI